VNVAPLESVLSSLESGARPKGGVSADSGQIPSVGGEHLNFDGGFDFTNIKRIPRSFFETMKGGRIAKADILVVKDGATTGKTSFVGDDFPFTEAAVNEHVFCVRVDSAKASPEYVYHFLRSARGQEAIQLDFRGATVGGISRQFATKARLPLPPLSEQRRIADILEKAEALRAKRRAALSKIDNLSQAIFLDLFGDPATNPKGFSAKPLASLVRDDDTINYGVVQPGDDLDEGIPLIRVGDLIQGKVRHSDLKRIRPSIEAAYKRSRLRGDEILVSCVGSIGVVALADESVKGFNIARAVARIPLAQTTSRVFMAAYLNTDFVQRYFTNELRTVSQPTLNIKQLSETTVVLPPIELQREFACRVGAVENLRTAQRASLAELEALFASLQHRAFRGEL
jgi:type I restriction enzyme S subunit